MVTHADVSARSASTDLSARAQAAVWLGMIVIVAMEVVLTYAHLSVRVLLAALLLLACIEAGLGLLYFMHLKFERAIFRWWTVPTLVFVLLMMNEVWPDAFRALTMRQ
jgi:heme/copper-type cytochrome/quinol oxidase subunit 4